MVIKSWMWWHFQDCEEAISALIVGTAWEEALRLVSRLWL